MPVLIDSYSEANQNDIEDVDGDEDIKEGQTFMGTGIPIQSVVLFARRQGLPTGTFTVYIYAHSGTYGVNGIPTGSALAASDPFTLSTLPTSTFTLTTITFSGANQITLANGTPYCLSAEYSGGDIFHALQLGVQKTVFTPPTHPGNLIYYISGAWNADATRDMCFYVYGRDPNVPQGSLIFFA